MEITPPNTLTPRERAEDWRLLFDGKTTEGWRGFHRRDFPARGWAVEDGCLAHRARGGGGDIITAEQFASFDLRLEWRIAPGSNSGLKYFVTEDLPRTGAALAFEFQLIDDERHPDARRGVTHSTGALYDLIAPGKKSLRPAGEWNEARLLARGRHVEHWLNGAKVVEFERGSERLKTLIAGSKYKGIRGFGEAERGHLLLQDHGDAVWFRNLKIRAMG